MDRLKRLFVVGALAVVVSVVVAGPAVAAKGGNSANAKACQKGGWESLFTASGGTFAKQGDCVSYGAQGGTLLGPFAGQAACAQAGGTFVADGGQGIIWECNRYSVPPNDGSPPELVSACLNADGGEDLSSSNNFDGTWSSACLVQP